MFFKIYINTAIYFINEKLYKYFQKKYYSYFCFFAFYKLINLIKKLNNILL